MAAKRMDQLSTISGVASSDLLLVYDISEGGSEKTKSILYSDFSSGIGGSTPDKIEEGDSYVEVIDAGTGEITMVADGTEIVEIKAATQRYGDTTRDYFVMSSNDISFYVAGANQRLKLGTNESTLGDPTDTYVYVNGSTNRIQLALKGAGDRLYLSDTNSRLGHSSQPNVTVTQPTGVTINATNAEKGIDVIANGAVELYYDGTKVFETTSAGVSITDGTNGPCTIGYVGETLQFINADANGHLQLLARNGADTSTNPLFDGDPDGSIILYRQGTATFTTNSSSVRVFNSTGGANYVQIGHGGTDGNIKNYTQGGHFTILGEATGGANVTCANFDPDGAADLYYDGDKQLETTESGISVTNGQVKFPATQVPSSDANTLDDYEEGSWTPTMADANSGGNTGTTGTGNYIKIGKLVTVWCNINNMDTTGLTPGNLLYIQGLPFTSDSSGSAQGAVRCDRFTFTDTIVSYLSSSTNAFYFAYSPSGAADGGITVADIQDDTADFWTTISYRAVN